MNTGIVFKRNQVAWWTKGCKNIIRLINYGEDKDNQKPWYLMPYVKYNLFDYIKRKNGKLSKEVRFDIASQVFNAIKYAHERDVLHRNISPNHVLVFLKTPNQ